MKDEPEISLGPIPEKYLDLRPHDTYEENIEAIDSLINGEYDRIGETYGNLHPRVFHSAFRDFYGQDSSTAKVDEEALTQMQDILNENSGEDYFWPEEKLFNHGYRRGPKGRRNLSSRRRERDNPHIPHGRDMMPDLDLGILENPVRQGREKREADEHYTTASMRLGLEISDYDIEIR